jgi:hypothetical protein
MDYFVGVDLGSHVDYSAVSVLERSMGIDPDTELPLRDTRGNLLYRWRLRGLYRFPLRTPYPEVAQKVARIASMKTLRSPPRVAVDSTGVGVSVLEMIRTAMRPFPEIEVWGVSITSGEGWRPVRRYELTCSKVQLVGALKAVLEDERLKMAWRVDGSLIRGAEALKKELRAFKVKMTKANNETFGADSGNHDDCVLALSLPIWLGSLPYMTMREPDLRDDPGIFLPGESRAIRNELAEEALSRKAEAEAQKRESEAQEREAWAEKVRRQREYENPLADHWWTAI